MRAPSSRHASGRASRRAALAAFAALLVYLAGLGYAGMAIVAVLPGFSHATTPMAALALRGAPGAVWFNASLVCAGLLAAVAASSLRARLAPSSPWSARIGARVLLLSALAFAIQGLLPLDPQDLDGPGSALRGIGWTLWWPALALGAALLAVGTRGDGSAGSVGSVGPAASRALPWTAAIGAPFAALWSAGLLGALPEAAPYWPQRLLPAAWLLWLCLLVRPGAAGRETA